MKWKLALVLAAVTVLTVVELPSYGKPAMKQASKVTVEFDTFDESGNVLTWSFHSDDAESIERIIAAPLQNAKEVKAKKDWQHLGQIHLVYSDAEEEVIWLYNPLGVFKRNDLYFSTEFTAVARELERFAKFVEKRIRERQQAQGRGDAEPKQK